MLFNSYIFLFLFLPLAFSGYFLFNHFRKYELSKYYLTGMSLWFYAYFNHSYLWIILASILVNYLCHHLMVSHSSRKKGLLNTYFVCGLLFNLGLLFYFKYFNFFTDTISQIFHLSWNFKKILLPLGISFFTFQQIAFLADTRKGELKLQKFSDYMLFVTFFPQLIAGPIVSHQEMLPQFCNKELKSVNYKNLYTGLHIFILGLSKKVLLADTLGKAADWGYLHSDVLHGFSALLVTVFYSLQLYLDFSGYCDMARGIGYLFNIKIPVNFFSPYKAENIQDFWSRWHMTLTRFFTRYLYIPLGGNRKGAVRTYVNIFIVFLVSGIWHGAGFTFIIWGMLHGIASIATRLFHQYKKKLFPSLKESGVFHTIRKVLAIAATFLFVNLAWVFFRADSLTQAFSILRSLFDFGRPEVFAELASLFDLPENWLIFKALRIYNPVYTSFMVMIIISLISAFAVWGCKNIAEKEETFCPTIPGCLFLSLLMVWCITSLSGVSSFLYFNF